MTDGSLDDWDQSDYAATRVVAQLDTFPEKFADLGSIDHLDSVLTGDRELAGPQVGQKPEVFTSQYLIEPVLHALGFYDPTSDVYERSAPHFVRQPSTFETIEQKRPDYYLRNVDDRAVCFVEAKAANRERVVSSGEDNSEGSNPQTEASDDVREYLASDTFCNVELLEQPHRRYVVGIATDGLRWALHAKDVETGETAMLSDRADLSGTITTVARDEDALAGEPGDRQKERRENVADCFTPYFGANTIIDTAISLFDG